MARAGFPLPASRRPRRTSLGEGAATLVIGTLTASAMLVGPIVLWKRYGDASVLRTAAVTLAAVLLCWAVVRLVTRRYPARRPPARTLAHAVAAAPPCRSQDVHHSAAQRSRRDPSARPCGPSRWLPRTTSRGARDVRCRAAARPLDRRGGRRRTRP